MQSYPEKSQRTIQENQAREPSTRENSANSPREAQRNQRTTRYPQRATREQSPFPQWRQSYLIDCRRADGAAPPPCTWLSGCIFRMSTIRGNLKRISRRMASLSTPKLRSTGHPSRGRRGRRRHPRPKHLGDLLHARWTPNVLFSRCLVGHGL